MPHRITSPTREEWNESAHLESIEALKARNMVGNTYCRGCHAGGSISSIDEDFAKYWNKTLVRNPRTVMTEVPVGLGFSMVAAISAVALTLPRLKSGDSCTQPLQSSRIHPW